MSAITNTVQSSLSFWLCFVIHQLLEDLSGSVAAKCIDTFCSYTLTLSVLFGAGYVLSHLFLMSMMTKLILEQWAVNQKSQIAGWKTKTMS